MQHLTSDERSQASVLWKAVTAATGLIENGENRPSTVVEEMRAVIARAPRSNPAICRSCYL